MMESSIATFIAGHLSSYLLKVGIIGPDQMMKVFVTTLSTTTNSPLYGLHGNMGKGCNEAGPY